MNIYQQFEKMKELENEEKQAVSNPSRYYYLKRIDNKHGGWGSIDLWEHHDKKTPCNWPVKERLLHYRNTEEREFCEEFVRGFNIMSGYGDYIG